jgi:multiple sugar transport system ATP-binding protein
VVNALQPKDRDIAMVFQNYALYQHMSVYDNLAFGLRNRRVKESDIEAAVRGAAKVLSIEALLDRRPKQLSGGQQQRVALGRCIVRNPKVFLFDEPLSNLDAQLRAQMRLEIKELRLRVPTDVCVRDPRSGRGHDARRPYRRHEGRPRAAGR